jgi:ribosomal protein L28
MFMAKCDICNKKSEVGRTSRHRRGVASKKFLHKAAKKRKVFKPNLQKITYYEAGKQVTKILCSSCIKRLKKDTSTQELITGKKPVSQNASA